MQTFSIVTRNNYLHQDHKTGLEFLIIGAPKDPFIFGLLQVLANLLMNQTL